MKSAPTFHQPDDRAEFEADEKSFIQGQPFDPSCEAGQKLAELADAILEADGISPDVVQFATRAQAVLQAECTFGDVDGLHCELLRLSLPPDLDSLRGVFSGKMLFLQGILAQQFQDANEIDLGHSRWEAPTMHD